MFEKLHNLANTHHDKAQEALQEAKAVNIGIKEDLIEAKRLAGEAQKRFETTDFAELAKQDHQFDLDKLQKDSDDSETQRIEINKAHEAELNEIKTRVEDNKEQTSEAQNRKDAAQENIKRLQERNKELKAELAEKKAEFDSLNSVL